jgi:hypothetical protein
MQDTRPPELAYLHKPSGQRNRETQNLKKKEINFTTSEFRKGLYIIESRLGESLSNEKYEAPLFLLSSRVR